MSWQFDMAAEVTPGDLYSSIPQIRGNPLVGAVRGFGSHRQGLALAVSSARELGIGAEGMLDPVSKLVGAAQLVLGGMMLAQGYQAAVAAKGAAESAIAAAETLAHAALLNWGGIALAGASAAVVYAGIEYASGSWQLPSVDLESPIDRARAARSIQEVR